MKVARLGSVVKVHYRGCLEDGSVFDESKNRAPLRFTVGEGQVIAGFEAAVLGKAEGQKVSVKIPPEQAYGLSHPGKILEVGRAEIPAGVNPRVGEKILIRGSRGERFHARVASVSESTVVLDANHELAGKTLNFEIDLLEVSP